MSRDNNPEPSFDEISTLDEYDAYLRNFWDSYTQFFGMRSWSPYFGMPDPRTTVPIDTEAHVGYLDLQSGELVLRNAWRADWEPRPILLGTSWYESFDTHEGATTMPRPPYASFAEHLQKWCADRGVSRDRLLTLLGTQERMLAAAERGDETYVDMFEQKLREHQTRVGEPAQLTKAQARALWEKERLARA